MAIEQEPKQLEMPEKALKKAKETGDAKLEASALVLMAQVYLATGFLDKAAESADAATRLFEEQKLQAGEVISRSISAAAAYAPDKSPVDMAESIAKMCKSLGDMFLEGTARLNLAYTHLAKLTSLVGKSMSPPRDTTLQIFRSAKAAYELFGAVKDADGQEKASIAAGNMMVLNGVSKDRIPAGSEIFKAKDIGFLLRELGATQSCFVSPAVHLRTSGGSGKAADAYFSEFNRTEFAWTDVAKDYTYTIKWVDPGEPTDLTLRNKLNMVGIGMGSRGGTLPLYHGVRPKDPRAMDPHEACVVQIASYDGTFNQGTILMSQLHTLSTMVVAKMHRLAFVTIGETPDEEAVHADEHKELAKALLNHPCLSGMIRSSRIEYPKLHVSLVAGDLVSWLNNRDAMIDNIFDSQSHDYNELETIWYRGKALVGRLNGPHEMPGKPIPKIAPKARTDDLYL